MVNNANPPLDLFPTLTVEIQVDVEYLTEHILCFTTPNQTSPHIAGYYLLILNTANYLSATSNYLKPKPPWTPPKENVNFLT